MPARPRIGITLGDPAGIGPEVVAKALKSGRLDRRFDYEVIGNPRTKRRADAVDWIVDGAKRCLKGGLAALATAPITKELLRRAGYPFVGQTELLAHLSGTKRFAMMLAGGPLRVALVTIHEPLRDVPKLIRPGKIIDVIELSDEVCRRFGIRRPRIAVAGLNPHAGEGGLLGNDEQRIIAPAVKRAARSGILVSGPHSADTLFYRAAHGEFDAVVAMYHDQGLAPLKLIAFDNGVNLTLGLPFVRTSPDHGTAPDIAGKGIARPGGMIAAINMAARLARARST
ncbi:MAG TPA: 4-hydroxythreonine-4-phosphate dehydrogenase PdxA [Verrucomicrobiae bacterium]|nr:4-hydroxythreonine-4-phosphate dehydrogenase PdxA [Verrucomicrobiae bacterium]